MLMLVSVPSGNGLLLRPGPMTVLVVGSDLLVRRRLAIMIRTLWLPVVVMFVRVVTLPLIATMRLVLCMVTSLISLGLSLQLRTVWPGIMQLGLWVLSSVSLCSFIV